MQEMHVQYFGRSVGIWGPGEEHPDTLMAMHLLALTYASLEGKHADAARMNKDVLEKRKRILGEEHPDTLTTMHNLAHIYTQQGRNADATSIQEDVLEKRKKISGEE